MHNRHEIHREISKKRTTPRDLESRSRILKVMAIPLSLTAAASSSVLYIYLSALGHDVDYEEE